MDWLDIVVSVATEEELREIFNTPHHCLFCMEVWNCSRFSEYTRRYYTSKVFTNGVLALYQIYVYYTPIRHDIKSTDCRSE